MDQFQVWVGGLASTPWIFLVVYLFVTVDGFFPPIPGESVVVAVTALWASTGEPNLAGILAVAAAGAFSGDQIAYQVGRTVPVRRLRLFRGPRGQAALAWAGQALARRGAALVVAGRYLPVGRVAVNMSAGALRYPRHRFVAVDAVASVMWALYSAVIGLAAGRLLGAHPVVAVVAGVVGGVVVGFGVDWAVHRFSATRSAGAPVAPVLPERSDAAATTPTAAPATPTAEATPAAADLRYGPEEAGAE